jgi:hypothetical protein
VEDYLRKSNALERWWRRPITSAQLQAELDRMAKSSQDPQILRELFAALGNDPLLIAETLARQTLADRLIRNWYASDTRFHGGVRRRAEGALATCARIDCNEVGGREYGETTFRLRGDTTDAADHQQGRAAVDLGTDEWHSAPGSSRTPHRAAGGLEETDDAFVVRAVLGRRDGEIVTASLAWPKRSFDAWWQSESVDRTDVIDQPRAA